MWWGDNTAVSMQRVLLLNVNTKGVSPVDPFRRGALRQRKEEQRIPDTEPRKRALLPSFVPRKRRNVVMHEEAGSGMPRESRSAVYRPDRSDLSGMYQRSKLMGSKKERRGAPCDAPENEEEHG